MKTNNYFTGQEGYCRRSIKENIQFLSIALGSLGENYSQVFTLFNADELSREWFDLYDQFHYSLENKLIHPMKFFLQIL